MPEFYRFLPEELAKYPNCYNTFFSEKLTKFPEFYMIVARKMPEF